MRGGSAYLPATDPAIAQRVLNDVVTFFAGTNEQTARQATEEARTIGSKIEQVEGQFKVCWKCGA